MITPFPAGGLFNRSTMNEKLDEIGGAITEANWQLIEVLDNTGPMSGTWTAPDFFGDGSAYDLGVYMIGGGGSGSVYKKGTSSTSVFAGGGASGYGKNFIIKNVVPGTEYAYVIGAKGAEATAASGSSSTSSRGNAGGTTSFNGVEAEGGEGGIYGSTSSGVDGASGGQGSDPDGAPTANRRLYGCVTPMPPKSTTVAPSYSQSPRDGQNQFDQTMVTLCAGGFAGDSYYQTVLALPDGTKGGNGRYNGTGYSATGYGNGGGGVTRGDSTAATSGSGSDGAIFLYARRSQEVTA